MSEKLFTLLLRLYPARFRQRYGEESLQLVRDRLRDEKGLLPRLRLGLDLLTDTALSLPRAHRVAASSIRSAAVAPIDHLPSFSVLEPQSLRPAALVLAWILAVAGIGAFAVLLRYGGRPFVAQNAGPMSQPAAPSHAGSPSGSSPAPGKIAPGASTGVSATVAQSLPASQPAAAAAANPPQENAPVASAPTALNATTAILQAFQHHDIVLLGEMHDNQQEYAFLDQLVKNPAFDDRVDDIVVEFGNARYQPIVDRYVAGDNVSFQAVRPAWRNMIASVPPVSPVYGELYQAVRDSNRARPGHRPLRLVMGSPPGDWDKIQTPQDLAPWEAQREQWYAETVKTEVLAKHHHALLIMGAGHFLRGFHQSLQDELLLRQHRPVPPLDPSQLGRGYIERTLRAAGANPWLLVFGTNSIDNHGDTDPRFDAWPLPAVVPLQGSWVGSLPAQPVFSGGHAPATPLTLADEADALLYVAPCRTLTMAFAARSDVDGTPWGKEVARRDTILVGHPVPFAYGEMPACVQPPPASP